MTQYPQPSLFSPRDSRAPTRLDLFPRIISYLLSRYSLHPSCGRPQRAQELRHSGVMIGSPTFCRKEGGTGLHHALGVRSSSQGCGGYPGRALLSPWHGVRCAKGLPQSSCDPSAAGVLWGPWASPPLTPTPTPQPGLLLKLPFLGSPADSQCYEDQVYWKVRCLRPLGPEPSLPASPP